MIKFRLKFFSGKRLSYIFLVLLLFSASAVSAQSIVNGTVKDNLGSPLPGVTILVKNTNKATSSVEDGSFSIAANEGDVLMFRYIGFENQEIVIGKQQSVNVVLLAGQTTLQDVVVTGYGTSSKAEITGAVTSIQAEDFNTGVVSSPAQLLQGKVSGLNITRSGDPNSNGSIILRGPSTLRAGAQEPFYVIDGIPGASIDLLAPDDIMSIDVLKDASSTAIYGSRAANGVIQVTTRKAKAGQSRIAYSGYAAREQVSNRIDMLSGDELRQYLEDNDKSLNASDNSGANTNWQDAVSRTGISQNHNLSFNGNANQTSYAASINYLNNNGIMKGSALERTILRASIEQKAFNERLRFNLSAVNSLSNKNNIPTEVYYNMLKYLPSVDIKRPDGSYTEDFSRTRGYLNPVSLIDNNQMDSKVKTFLGNALAEAKILPGLQYTLSLSLQDEQTNNDTYYNHFSGLAQNLNGVATRSSYSNTKKIVESFLNYEKSFSSHTVKFLAGYSWQEDRNGNGFQTSNQNFVNDELSYNNLGLGDPLQGVIPNYGSGRIQTLRLISYYGRFNYQFDNRYLFQATIRRDGSSAFGKNNRWGYFPSFSAGWRINNEKFMENVTFLEDLKLRVGYGVSGNTQGFDAFTKILLYSQTGRFYYNGRYINAIGPFQNENPDLKWERTAMTNIGLDIAVLKGRLSASIDVYDKKTSDLIANYPVSTTQYFVNTLVANAGKISNKGIEVIIDAIPFTSTDFRWKTSLNFSHNENKIVSLSNDRFNLPYILTANLGGKGQSGNFSQIVQEGSPLGSFNIWKYAGKDENGVTQIYKADGTTTLAPSSADVYYAGNAQPKLLYGWNNNFSYKNFDLNFFIRGVYGNKILNATLADLNSPGDATAMNMPQFTLGESANDNNAYLISDRYLESGTYLRMDNATLAYTFNAKIKNISKLRLYVTGDNLFILTKYRGIDPEVNMGGLEPGIDNNNYYPKTRSFLVGLNVIF